MYRIFIFILTGIIFSFIRTPLPENSFNAALNAADSIPKFSTDIEKWPAVAAEDAQSLAKQQGDTWKKNLKDKKILIGLGANGQEKLDALIHSSDSTSKMLMAQMMKAANVIVAKNLPAYVDPAQAVRKGQTATTAGTQEWMRYYADQAVLLSVAARVSNNPAYRQRLHDMVMRFCEFGSWGAAPRNGDLAAGHVSRAIAMAWNWQPDLWSASDRRIIIDTIRSRVETLAGGIYAKTGFWWAGAYISNVNQVSAAGAGLTGVAFLNDIPEAREWLAASWLNFKEVAKHSYADGSGAEGTSYWSYGMSFILQFIEAANGILPAYSLYDYPCLKNAAAFRINCSTPGFHEIISWGDSDPHDFAGPAHYMFRFASQYHNGQARYLATHANPGFGGNDDVKAWAWLWSQPPVEEQAPGQLDYFASSSDLINSRSGWGEDDYVFTFKSGYTNRSHSHLDAGSIGLIAGSDWLLATPRYGKGRVNGDFWDRSRGGRWRYQSNATEANSTLVVNKGQQLQGESSRGIIDHYASYDQAMTAECDLSAVYLGVTAARRKIFHRRGAYIVVQDAVALKEPGLVEWLIQAPPNAVITGNTVNIQGKGSSASITLLSPQSGLSGREPMSEVRDIAEQRNTFSAGMNGKSAGFIAVIEPKLHGANAPERSYALTPEGAVEVKSSGTEERLRFADRPTVLEDKITGVTATAGFMYVRTGQDKLSDVIVTDAKNLTVGPLQLLSGSAFSGSLVKKARSWKLNLISGQNIVIKAGGKATKMEGSRKGTAGPAISGPGNYMIE